MHAREHGARRLKGIRGRIQFSKDIKAWSEGRSAVLDAREARVAAGVEAVTEEELADEEFLATPKPEKANLTTSCSRMKLASFCPNPAIRRLLNKHVMDTNVMVAEGYAFANLHVTRLLEQGKAVPMLNQSFFHSCLTAVTKCDGAHCVDMTASITRFDALRPSGEAKVDSVPLASIREEVAIAMAAEACTTVWSTFPCVLGRYLAIAHPTVTKQWRKVVIDCVALYPRMALTKVDKLSLKTPKGKTIPEGRRRAIVDAIALIEELRRTCPVKTVGVACKAHTLLPFRFEMMRHIEAAYAAARDTAVDGDRRELARARKSRFTLLPMKRGFTVSNVPICGRAWMAILTRVSDGNGVKLAKTRGSDSGHDEAWRKHCNVNMVETRTRTFGGRIVTDGVAVSVHMDRERAILLSKTNEEWDAERINREKGCLPVLYSGVDPGFTDVVTVAHSSELQDVRSADDKSVPATVSSFSASQYAEKSKQKWSVRMTSKWNKETDAEVASIWLETDRSTVDGLAEFTRSYLAVFRTLLGHRAKRGYRAARFTRFVFKQRTVSEICDLIAPLSAYNVVGYGDWRSAKGTPVKRRWSGPQEDIRRELQRRPNVLFWNMWEYRTSVTCHKTWRRLTNMRARTTRFDRTSRTMTLSAKRASVHKVLHCKTSGGAKGHPGGGTWNRDANASRNMLMLMMLEVLGVQRPGEFLPAVTVERRRKQGRKSANSTPTTSLSSAPRLQLEGPEG